MYYSSTGICEISGNLSSKLVVILFNMLFGSQTNPWKTSVCVCDECVKEGWDVDSVQMPGSVVDKTL